MLNPNTKICIYNEQGQPLFQWTITRWHFKVFHFLKRTSLGLGLILLAFWPLYAFANYSLGDAQKTQIYLEEIAAELQTDMKDVASELSGLQQNENRLRKRSGLNNISHELFMQGVGGPANKDSLFQKMVFPKSQLKSDLHSFAQTLTRQTSFSHENLSTLRKITEQNVNFWRHTPSILPTEGRLTSGFGIRTHPVTGEANTAHNGLDISNKLWTPILSSADGIIKSVKSGGGFGNNITIDHGNAIVTRFAHLNKAIVKVGDFVQRYQPIGYMGNTGRSTGSHLHYEVHLDGKPVNPIRFILPADQVID